MLLFFKICVVLSVLVFVIGMIKPKWIFFFMREPDRLSVSALAMVMFMGAWTGIAKMTLKPKERVPVERSAQEANELKLTR